MKNIVVQKYGGSSLASLEMMDKVARYIKETYDSGRVPVAVVSAMGKETDRLIETVKGFYEGEPPVAETDKVQATGEDLAASLLAIAIHKAGLEAVSLTGWQIGLETDRKNRQKIKRIRDIDRIRDIVAKGKIVVVTGFQGVIEGTDEIATLGRGGSDLTAIALAGALNQSYCEIYTDVDGVYAVNPQLVPGAKMYDQITYDMMIELSARGAKVLLDRSVELARKLNVGIKVMLSPSFGQSSGGTLVGAHTGNLQEMETGEPERIGLAVQKHLAAMVVSSLPHQPDMISKVFSALSRINLVDAALVPVKDMSSIVILCQESDLGQALSQLKTLEKEIAGLKVTSLEGMAGLTLVSPLMKEGPSYLSRFAGAVGEVGVSAEMIASSGTTILYLIKEEELSKAALSVAKKFNLIQE